MQLQSASGRGGIDALVQAHEAHAQGLQLVQQGDQVLEVAAQAIESPADQDIDEP